MTNSKSQITNHKMVTAKASFVKNSPRKLRLITDAVSGIKDPNVAVSYLKALPQAAARPILNLFLQALGNAKNNFKLSPFDMSVKTLVVHEGPKGAKKMDIHSHGARFDRGVRRKRLSHVTLELVTKEVKEVPSGSES